MRELSVCENLLVRLLQRYVAVYPQFAFQLTLDDLILPRFGNADRVISVAIRDAPRVCQRIFTEGSLGLGECYCDGMISVADNEYRHLLLLFVRAVYDRKLRRALSLLDALWLLWAGARRGPVAHGDQEQNINAHYSMRDWFNDDAFANRFYLAWLDARYIQYSCGRWAEGVTTLEEAQINKFEFYCRRLGIDSGAAGSTLLELGCGWGGFMFYVAEHYGLDCTGITLSTAQGAYISDEITRRGLTGRVRVQVKNAHDLDGSYDHIVAIGLLEHISDYDRLFAQTARCLKPGGSALFHAMFHARRRYVPDPWLVKYIFPGGAVPDIRRVCKILRRYFSVVDRNDLPPQSYARTLHCWHETFCRKEGEIRAILADAGCGSVDDAVRVFKHYLVLAESGLTVNDLMCNVLVRDPVR